MSGEKRVLVFRTGHLGDTVCAIPAFRLIRRHFPDAELMLLCDRPDNSVKVPVIGVIEDLHIFDQIATYSSVEWSITAWRIIQIVRDYRPDVVVMLPQVRETSRSVRRKKLLFQSCGVPDTRGLQLRGSSHAWQPTEANRLVLMLNKLGIDGTKPTYDLPVDSATQRSVEERLRAICVNPSRPFVVFCGGGKASTQCWPLERYAAVLLRLAAETGSEVFGVGHHADLEDYRARILPTFSALRLPLAPFTVTEMFEVCRRALVYFGNDTGPMHVSAAVDCPVAVVMSARNAPGSWDPDVERRLVIRHRTECEDCFLTDCVAEKHRCLAEITVEQVAADVVPFVKSLQRR